MLAFINYLLCLALGLAGFAAGTPFPGVLDSRNASSPSALDYIIWQHNGKALTETWVGRRAVNVGDIPGEGLYKATKEYMQQYCGPQNKGWCDELGYWQTVNTHGISNFPNIKNTYFQMNTAAQWSSEEIRKEMISQMALTMQELTSTAENCYVVPGHNVQCNVGDFVFINYPSVDGHKNFIRMKFFSPGPDVYDKFRCCRSLNMVDKAGDILQEWIRGNFNAPYSRDSRCLIYDDKTCGQCGTKCDECGNSCDDVCPGGNCSF